MNNQEFQIKIQAYFDGELSPSESAQVTSQLEHEPDGALLLTEFKNTQGVLRGFEADCKVPESREFYWSKIARQIELESSAPSKTERVSLFVWLRRHLFPVSSVALACGLLALITVQNSHKNIWTGEMELAAQDMGAYTFRDQQQQMTTVWLYNHDDSEFTPAASAATMSTE